MEEVIGMWSANTIRQWAENQRRSVSFTADHPAVKAARRYCERTGRTWHIGIGGRCELGKRAIKQWLYEWSQPLVKAWRAWLGATLGITLLFTAVLLGLFASWMITLSIVTIVVAFVLVVIGGVCGYTVANDPEAPMSDMWKVTAKDFDPDASPLGRWLVAAVLIVAAPFSLAIYGIIMLSRKRVTRAVVQALLKGLFWCVVGLCLYVIGSMLYWLWITEQLIGVLVMMAWMLGLAGVGVGLFFGLGWLLKRAEASHGRKVEAVYASERANDQVVQAAYERLKPFLMDEFQKAEKYFPAKSKLHTYDAWIEAFAACLAKCDLAWTDLVRYESGSDRYDLAKRLGDFPDVADSYGVFRYYGDFLDFRDALLQWQLDQLPPRKQRWVRAKQVVSFVAATAFLLKSKVCPNVELPDWDAVGATKS